MKSNRSISSNQDLEERAEANDGAADGPFSSQQSAEAKPVTSTKVFKEQTPSSSRTTLSITIERNGKSPQNSQAAAAETKQATNAPSAPDSKESRESPASTKSDSQDLSNQSSASLGRKEGPDSHRSDAIKTSQKAKKKHRGTHKSRKGAAGETDSNFKTIYSVLFVMLTIVAFLLVVFLLIYFEANFLLATIRTTKTIQREICRNETLSGRMKNQSGCCQYVHDLSCEANSELHLYPRWHCVPFFYSWLLAPVCLRVKDNPSLSS